MGEFNHFSNIEPGDYVIIKSIENTKRSHGLDSTGIMKSMVGRRWLVRDATYHTAMIRSPKDDFTFTWSVKDLMLESEVKEPEPIIFKFDEKHLEQI